MLVKLTRHRRSGWKYTRALSGLLGKTVWIRIVIPRQQTDKLIVGTNDVSLTANQINHQLELRY